MFSSEFVTVTDMRAKRQEVVSAKKIPKKNSKKKKRLTNTI